MSTPSLPTSFQQRLTAQLGTEQATQLIAAITAATPAPVSIRLNPSKKPEQLPAPTEAPIPWASEAFYLTQRPKFTFDPLLHAGCYYVQEAASMAIEAAYRAIEADFTPHRLLDLCAAPGGKSTLWRSLLPEGELLVANEPIRSRAHILSENLTKWGHPDVICTQSYPEAFSPLGSYFDVIAADVPCSGEGMFRKDTGAIDEWSEANVITCQARQRSIIESVWPALRQHGYLVYSTCTYNREENEDNVAYICQTLGAEPVPIPALEALHISGDTTGRGLPVYHFYPHLTRGEGLFLALLRKTSEAPHYRTPKSKRPSAAPAGSSQLADYLRQPDAFKFIAIDATRTIAMRRHLAPDVALLSATVHCLTAGILLAETKGKRHLPQHALALSTEINRAHFPTVNLPLTDALAYLRREAITLPPSTPRGHVLITYQGHPLGWANHLGTRTNNLYPAEWRIRTT